MTSRGRIKKNYLYVLVVFVILCSVAQCKVASPATPTQKTPLPSYEDCEKRVPSSYTAAQKKQLCTPLEDVPQHSTIGPAICASVAKQMLHGNAKFEMILQLCQGASSAAPVQCYDKLDSVGSTLKAKFGLDLCARADSTLPGECFSEVSAFSGTNNKVKPEVLSEFCRSLEDRAPLLCVHAVKETGMAALPQAIEVCSEVVGSGGKAGSRGNTAAADCIRAMQAQVKPSFGVTANDVLRFCMESNPAAYAEHQLPTPSGSGSESIDEGQEEASVQGAAGASPPAECYVQAALVTQSAGAAGVAGLEGASNTPLLTPKQRLSLCANAHTAQGPLNCTTSALSKAGSGAKGNNAAVSTGLKASEVVELCRGAQNQGPAECFVGARNLGTTEERTQLCNGAFNAGPAHCYRRAANVFRNDVGNRSLLCVGADSEDPATCANAAPHYLAMSEKVDLCAGTPPSRGQDPGRCLSAVEAASKAFKQAPKKALGYFLDSLWDARDRKSRALLVAMCSFGASQDPIAAAECFRSAPHTLDHDDAARMCTDIPSAAVIEHMQLCHRLLPKEWASEEASVLCEQTTSRAQVEATLKCAVEASTKMIFPKLSRVQAAQVCAAETSAGPVLSCVREISKGVSASSASAYLVTPEVVVAVCNVAGSGGAAPAAESAKDEGSKKSRSAPAVPAVSAVNPGQCLAKLAAISTSRLIFDSTVPPYLCAQADSAAVLTCLDKLHKRMVNIDDVTTCLNTKQEVKTMRVKRILTEDNGIEIMAGKRFSLWLELLDQFGRRFSDPHQQYLFSASLNANNPQGAVLWGIRSNYSSTSGDGLLQLNSLVISQAGEVDFKISVSSRSGAVPTATSSGAGSGGSSRSSSQPQLVEVFRIAVAEDPVVASAAPCIYVLQQTQCPAGANTQAEWESEFPRTRSYTPADGAHFLRNVHCAGVGLDEWHVGAFLSADGSLWVEYRMGIDSLWTGVGMPKMEMSPMERLGLFSSEEGIKSVEGGGKEDKTQQSGRGGKPEREGRGGRKRERAAQKEIRRAYYRRSLQWHPDRWAGLGMYALAVQGAFELVNEAYNALTAGDGGSGGSGSDASGEGETAAAEVIVQEPVYD